MLLRLAPLALVLVPSLAVASPRVALVDSADHAAQTDAVTPPGATPRLERAAAPEHLVALSVNEPFGWAAGNLAASASIGLQQHVALRVNVARYGYHANPAGEIIALAMGDDGDEAWRSGRFLDTGVGVTYYPRKLWSGFTLEVGMNIRQEKTHIEDEFATPYSTDRDINTYAARWLAGWSWLIHDRVTISFALGASAGAARGSETTIEADYGTNMMPVTRPVHDDVWAPEGYLRFGVTL